MLLVADMGNTTTVYGVYQRDVLAARWRISTDSAKTVDEVGLWLRLFLQQYGLSREEIAGVAIASVVPTVLPSLVAAVRRDFHIEPLVIGPGVKSGIPIRFENPREVGADRICNAVAVVNKYGTPAIIVDFGTSTNFDVISKTGEYLGGAIAPGISLSMDALFKRASRLPQIDLGKPRFAIGRNTAESIRAGTFYGFYGQLKEIVSRITAEMRETPVVVATGSMNELFVAETDIFQYIDADLTLEGLRLIYEYNKREAKMEKDPLG